MDVQRNIDAGAVDAIRIGANERLLIDHLAAVRELCERVDAPPAPALSSP